MNKFFSVLLVFLIFFTITGLAQKDKFKDFNFPPDFGKTESMVLISAGSTEKITEAIIEIFEKEFKGAFITSAEMKSNPDKNKNANIRYVFIIQESFNPGYSVGRDRFPPTTDYKFGLRDNNNGKTYFQDFLSGSYKRGAKHYIENLEKYRAKNAAQ